MGEEGCIREKSMNEDQEKRRIKGCKINLYPLKTLLPFPHPCTLLLTNKGGGSTLIKDLQQPAQGSLLVS